MGEIIESDWDGGQLQIESFLWRADTRAEMRGLEEASRAERRARVGERRQQCCARECFTAGSPGEKKALIYSVYRFPWCKYSHTADFKPPT